MEMDKERFLSSGLLEQYVLGLTDPEETREVENYLKVFPELRRDVEKMRQAIEQYAMGQAIPAPPRHRSGPSLEAEWPAATKPINKNVSRPEKERTQLRQRLTLAAGLAIILLAVSMAMYQRMVNVSHHYRELNAEFALFRQQCEEKNTEKTEQAILYAFLKHADTRPVHLYGTELAPEAEVVVYWNEQEHQAYLNPVNLPAPPPGKQYQVWADVDGQMINMGVLESSITELHILSFIDRAESINITIEPAGGSFRPTVAFLLANGKV